MDNERLQLFKAQIDTLKNVVTKAEFQQLVRLILKAQADVVENNKKLNSELMKMFDEMVERTTKSNKSELESLIADTQTTLKKLEKEEQSALNFLRDKVKSVKNGTDGNDGEDGVTPTNQQLIQLIKPLIPPPLKAENPKAWEVEGLDEYIRDRLPKKLGGAAHTDMGVQYTLGRIVQSETPSGAINGSNTAYTVSGPIHAVFSFAINGMAINDDEYTIAGNTITMNTAIPAELSGTSFRIKYV